MHAAADDSLASEPAAAVVAGSESEPRRMLADPTVARIKFDRQIAEYRVRERDYIQRGWYLIRAEFPEVTVAFVATHFAPPAVLYAVTLDFTDYDFLPPSVRFVNPFTLEPVAPDRLPNSLPKRTTVTHLIPAASLPDGIAAGAEVRDDGMVEIQQVLGQPLVQVNGGKPFLCIVGVREYHEHPMHSNDPWLPYRDTGRGRLNQILEVIWRHGVLPARLRVQVTGVQLSPDVLRVFHSRVVCGGALIRLSHGDGQADTVVEVPIAFQSALAGILLGAEIVIDAASLRDEGSRDTPPVRTVIDLLRPLPQYVNPPAGRSSDGHYLCADPDRLHVYREKYGLHA
jgi:hypothetical protein